jgi:hypothetical protein
MLGRGNFANKHPQAPHTTIIDLNCKPGRNARIVYDLGNFTIKLRVRYLVGPSIQ